MSDPMTEAELEAMDQRMVIFERLSGDECTRLIAEVRRLRGQWISVDDRLPEPLTPVLCRLVEVRRKPKMQQPHDMRTFRNVDEKRIEDGYFDPSRLGAPWSCTRTGRVTHWQPLPPPPKEQGSNIKQGVVSMSPPPKKEIVLTGRCPHGALPGDCPTCNPKETP